MDNEDCEDCAKVVSFEKVLAVTGLVAGVLIVAFACDLLTGGRLSGLIDGIGQREVTADE